jgi:hypothetical protein
LRVRFFVLFLLLGILSPIHAQIAGHATVDGEAANALSDQGLRMGWENEPQSSPFREGSWVAMTYGSGIFGNCDDNVHMYNAHLGVGYYFANNLSFNLQSSGYYGAKLSTVGTPNEGSFYGGSIEGLLRYHAAHYGTWSVFVEAGSGISQMSRSVPTGGTHFNFVLTAGVGLTKRLDEDIYLIGGCRWFHLSNGSFFNDPNPGLDAKMFYGGLLRKY